MPLFIPVTLLFIVLGGVHLYLLLKRRFYGEAAMSTALLAIALFYAYAELFYWDPPKPGGLIAAAFSPLAKLIFGASL